MIKGMYSYAGEFFIDAFEGCGDGGIYKTSKEKVGVVFAPYIFMQHNTILLTILA